MGGMRDVGAIALGVGASIPFFLNNPTSSGALTASLFLLLPAAAHSSLSKWNYDLIISAGELRKLILPFLLSAGIVVSSYGVGTLVEDAAQDRIDVLSGQTITTPTVEGDLGDARTLVRSWQDQLRGLIASYCPNILQREEAGYASSGQAEQGPAFHVKAGVCAGTETQNGIALPNDWQTMNPEARINALANEFARLRPKSSAEYNQKVARVIVNNPEFVAFFDDPRSLTDELLAIIQDHQTTIEALMADIEALKAQIESGQMEKEQELKTKAQELSTAFTDLKTALQTKSQTLYNLFVKVGQQTQTGNRGSEQNPYLVDAIRDFSVPNFTVRTESHTPDTTVWEWYQKFAAEIYAVLALLNILAMYVLAPGIRRADSEELYPFVVYRHSSVREGGNFIWLNRRGYPVHTAVTEMLDEGDLPAVGSGGVGRKIITALEGGEIIPHDIPTAPASSPSRWPQILTPFWPQTRTLLSDWKTAFERVLAQKQD
jgi:hypothetical protein